MLVQALRATLYLVESQSLKDKRQVRQSLVQRLKGMNISVIESEQADDKKQLVLLMSFVSSSESQAREKMGRIKTMLEESSDQVRLDADALYWGN